MGTRKTNYGHASVLAACTLAPLAALCDDAPAPPPPQGVWTGKGQAGYVSSQGNSEGKSANAALDTSFLDGPWKHMLHLGGLYGESANIVSAERWDVQWETDYALTERLYVFGSLHYLHDMFSGFQYQATGSGGVGYKLIDTDKTKLSVQAGAGYSELRPEIIIKDSAGAVTARIPQPSQNGAVGTFGLNYSQALTATTTLSDKLQVESSSANTLTTNALALAVKISTKLALSVGYAIQNNSKPPEGLKKLDSVETVNLVYSF